MIASMMSVGAFAEESEVVANGDYKFEIIVKSYQSSYWQAAVKGIDSVKESRGQPKSGALKQATCKGNF